MGYKSGKILSSDICHLPLYVVVRDKWTFLKGHLSLLSIVNEKYQQLVLHGLGQNKVRVRQQDRQIFIDVSS